MDIHITLPEYGKKGRIVRDLVVSILVHKHPLSVNELHKQIKWQYKHSVSYQAVHKVVNELILEKVLENVLDNDGKNVEISNKWVNEIIKFGKVLGDNYGKG
ncbi:MAG: hypothetical protein ABII01_00170 [Candidatus Woesearchaeota archaeon]